MDNEKRKSRRLDLEVKIVLDRLDNKEAKANEMVVEVLDLSANGMGFKCDIPLEIGAVYNTQLTIWTKEVINAIIRVIRCNTRLDGGYTIGCSFVGMISSDKLKIDIYDMLNP